MVANTHILFLCFNSSLGIINFKRIFASLALEFCFNSSLGIINSEDKLSGFSVEKRFQFLIRYYKFCISTGYYLYIESFNSSLGIINIPSIATGFVCSSSFNSSLGIINCRLRHDIRL